MHQQGTSFLYLDHHLRAITYRFSFFCYGIFAFLFWFWLSLLLTIARTHPLLPFFNTRQKNLMSMRGALNLSLKCSYIYIWQSLGRVTGWRLAPDLIGRSYVSVRPRKLEAVAKSQSDFLALIWLGVFLSDIYSQKAACLLDMLLIWTTSHQLFEISINSLRSNFSLFSSCFAQALLTTMGH